MQILVATLRGAVHQQQRAAAYAALLPSLEYSTKFRGNSDSEKRNTSGFGEDLFFWSSPNFRRKNTSVFGEDLFFWSSPTVISGEKTHQFLDSRRRLLSFLVFIQFRRRNHVIFTEVQSRLQKRPPMQNFTI